MQKLFHGQHWLWHDYKRNFHVVVLAIKVHSHILCAGKNTSWVFTSALVPASQSQSVTSMKLIIMHEIVAGILVYTYFSVTYLLQPILVNDVLVDVKSWPLVPVTREAAG